jgi:hypothetical protein
MRRSSRVIGALAAACVVAGTSFFAAGAFGATSRAPAKGGVVQVVSYGNGQFSSDIIFTGAIGDWGTATNIDPDGTVDPNGSEVHFSLLRGGFAVNIAPLDPLFQRAFSTFRPNPSTCSGTISVTGTVPLVSGSGTSAYKAISGSFKVTVTQAVIGPKYTSRKQKGQCNFSNSAPTLEQGMVVIGSGTVSLG